MCATNDQVHYAKSIATAILAPVTSRTNKTTAVAELASCSVILLVDRSTGAPLSTGERQDSDIVGANRYHVETAAPNSSGTEVRERQRSREEQVAQQGHALPEHTAFLTVLTSAFDLRKVQESSVQTSTL